MRLRYADAEMPRTNRRHMPVQPVATRARRALNLDASERARLRSAERGEWARAARFLAAKARYARYAKATLHRRRQA
jgi:hypothetical protein